MKESRKQTLITMGIVTIIILLIAAGTYAFITWSSRNIAIADISDCFDVKYIKGEDIGSDDNPAQFTLADNYTEGLSSSLSVYLKNTCGIAGGNGTLYLNIDLDTTSELLLGSGILKYQVLDGTTKVSNGIVGNNSSQVIYDNISITREEKTITIYLWADGNVVDNNNINEVLSSLFKGNISLKVESNEVYNPNIALSKQTLNRLSVLNSSIKEDILNTPDFTTVSGESGTYVSYDGSGETTTVPGDGTKGIYTALDDDGISYYFRGAVDNNYVSFAGYIWRIIRINGDGTIRMIYYGVDNGDGTYDIDYAVGTSAYNENDGDNAYVGYMYGTPGSSTYEETHSNTNNSTIKTYVDNWYNTNLASYETYIAETTYCNDRSVDTAVFTGPGIGTEPTTYSAYSRLSELNSTRPSLKCTNSNDRLTLKVGLITADEIAFAGAKGLVCDRGNDGNCDGYTYTITNTDFYLYSPDKSYWTMTPDINMTIGQLVYLFNSMGIFHGNGIGASSVYVRPVISLKSDVISGGKGTYNEPFIVG